MDITYYSSIFDVYVIYKVYRVSKDYTCNRLPDELHARLGAAQGLSAVRAVLDADHIVVGGSVEGIVKSSASTCIRVRARCALTSASTTSGIYPQISYTTT